MIRALPFLLLAALTLWCLVDCVQTPAAAVRRLQKPLWLALIAVVPVLGPVAWLLAGRPQRGSGPRPVRPQPLGPDDDPEFLRRLAWERNRQDKRTDKQEDKRQGTPDEDGPSGAARHE